MKAWTHQCSLPFMSDSQNGTIKCAHMAWAIALPFADVTLN
jgi:hypothetical protein